MVETSLSFEWELSFVELRTWLFVLMNNFNVKKYDVKKYDINKTLTQYLKKILYFSYYSATDIQILVNH